MINGLAIDYLALKLLLGEKIVITFSLDELNR